MKFFRRKPGPAPWKKKFAFFPTAVARSATGQIITVWLGLYEERCTRYQFMCSDVKRRLVGAPEGYSALMLTRIPEY